MSELVIEVSSHPTAAVVTLIGDAGMQGAAELDRRLLVVSARRPAKVVFDLTQLKFISSICMGSLVHFRQGIVNAGGRVLLAGAQTLVGDALKRARLDQKFIMHPSVESALGDG